MTTRTYKVTTLPPKESMQAHSKAYDKAQKRSFKQRLQFQTIAVQYQRNAIEYN